MVSYMDSIGLIEHGDYIVKQSWMQIFDGCTVHSIDSGSAVEWQIDVNFIIWSRLNLHNHLSLYASNLLCFTYPLCICRWLSWHSCIISIPFFFILLAQVREGPWDVQVQGSWLCAISEGSYIWAPVHGGWARHHVHPVAGRHTWQNQVQYPQSKTSMTLLYLGE